MSLCLRSVLSLAVFYLLPVSLAAVFPCGLSRGYLMDVSVFMWCNVSLSISITSLVLNGFHGDSCAPWKRCRAEFTSSKH